jgi:hypothetical protein
MARVHVMGGYLNVEGMSGEYPGNELPGAEGPVDPGYGISADRPSNPIVLPPDPPGVWPGPRPSHPIVIAPPGTPPGVIWPSPGRPVDPGYGRPVAPPHPGGGPMPGNPPRPDAGLPGGQGGQIDNALPSQTFWMLAYCPSQGWMYISVDPSLRPGMPLPPHAQPK